MSADPTAPPPGRPAGARRRGTPMLLLAGLLSVLSLGLAWGVGWSGYDSMYVPGWYVAGGCYTDYDYEGYGTVICDPGTFSPGVYLPGSDGGRGATGAQHSARAFLAVGWALVGIGRWQRNRRLQVLAPAVMALGVVADGVGNGAGFVVALAAVACLARSLQLDGLLRLPRPGLRARPRPAAP